MYPAEAIPDYSREQFIEDLLREHETEIRRCLKKGAYKREISTSRSRASRIGVASSKSYGNI